MIGETFSRWTVNEMEGRNVTERRDIRGDNVLQFAGSIIHSFLHILFLKAAFILPLVVHVLD